MGTSIVVAVGMLLMSGCGQQSGTGATSGGVSGGASGDAGDNSGGMNAVTKLSDVTGNYTDADHPNRPAAMLKDTIVTLQILDHSIRMSAGCNTLAGDVRVEDSQLVVDGVGLAMTEMACDTKLMDQDAWLAKAMTQRPTIERSGPYLALNWGDGGWLGFTRSDWQVLPGGTADPDKPVSNSATTEPGPKDPSPAAPTPSSVAPAEPGASTSPTSSP
ncbi:META domain-containing protein [Nostocoides jenkinsii]|uniref:DUF306 domain-containing protein n=1 Tax=Nostocoides jenkinsii Ben 74 TaxID=1193518 RepID=A0A077M2J9_9MICO|nr:META domain-containing protein [Tetrasphaera jenkinsii]CCI51296.1 exported hypothetical protein [Tetrasphaera jenkinsii Ben 74]